MTEHKHEERANKPMRRVPRIIYILLLGVLCLFAGWEAAVLYHNRLGGAPRLLLAPTPDKEGTRSEGTIHTLDGHFAVGLAVPANLIGKVQASPSGGFDLEFHTQPWNP
jgi:hypothetical protein